MKKIIMTLDLDAFFASCEELKKPELKKHAIGVGNRLNNRGIISAANYNARQYGVGAGTPIFKAKTLCPNIKIVNHDIDFYLKKSEEVFNVINSFVSSIELGSIDECHIDVTKFIKEGTTVLSYARKIQEDVFRKTCLSISIGISTNKILSKAASKLKKPKGISTLFPWEIEQKFWCLPISKLFGVGKALEGVFLSNGIKTIKQIAFLQNDSIKYEKLQTIVGKNLNKLILFAQGEGDDEIDNSYHQPKSISIARTFSANIGNIKELKEIIKNLSLYISNKSISRNLVGKTITLMTKEPKSFQQKNQQTNLKFYTNDFETIYIKAVSILEKNWKQGNVLKYIGVSLKNLKDGFFILKQQTFDDLVDKNLSPNKNKKEIKKGNNYNLIKELNLSIGYEGLVNGETLQKHKKFNSKNIENDKIKFKTWN